MNNWTPKKLSEICLVNPETRNRNWIHSEIEYIDISSVGTGQFIETPKKLSLKDAPSRAQRIVRNGDIIVSTVRPNRRSFLYLKETKPETVVSTGFAVLRAKEKNDSRFLYYLVTNQEFTDYLVSKAEGSAYPAVNPSVFSNADVLVPDYEEQKAIAKILSSLDDKIELNRQMNATLEAMARALFKAWFVDFEPVRANMENRPSESASPEIAKLFPSEFENGIPKGWEEKPIIEFFTLIGGGTPKTSNPDFWNGEILWYSVVDAPNESDVFVIDTAKKITPLGLEKSSTKLLRKGVTIISARGTVGKLAITGSEMTMNQSCYAIEGKFGDYFNYYVVNAAVAELKQKTHGAVFDTITQDTFKTIYQVLPKPNIISAFEKSVGSIMQKIEQNLRENKNLAEIRDSLLPRLISGKIRVGEAENAIAQSV
jgi:Restriction endonuclease S subunits